MPEEKRRERRLPIRGCTARLGGSGAPMRVVDLSTTGMQIVVPAAPAVGLEVRIDLATPQYSRPIPLAGRVAWARPTPDGSAHRIGIEFGPLQPAARSMLDELQDEGLHREMRPRGP